MISKFNYMYWRWVFFLNRAEDPSRVAEAMLQYYQGGDLSRECPLEFNVIGGKFHLLISYRDKKKEEKDGLTEKSLDETMVYHKEEFEYFLFLTYHKSNIRLPDDFLQRRVFPELERTKQRFFDFEQRIHPVLESYENALHMVFVLDATTIYWNYLDTLDKFDIEAFHDFENQNIGFEFFNVERSGHMPNQYSAEPETMIYHLKSQEGLPLYHFENDIIYKLLAEKHPKLMLDSYKMDLYIPCYYNALDESEKLRLDNEKLETLRSKTKWDKDTDEEHDTPF